MAGETETLRSFGEQRACAKGSTHRGIEGLRGEGADMSFGVCEALRAGRQSPACSLAEPRVLVCRGKAPVLVWIVEGGWGCGDEGPLRSFEKRRVAVGRVVLTKALTLIGRV